MMEMPKKRDLVVIPPSRKPYSKFISGKLGEFYVYGNKGEFDEENTDFMVLDVPFGLIPLEVDELYPLSQSATPKIRDKDSLEFINHFFKEFIEDYNQVLVHSRLKDKLDIELVDKFEDDDIRYKKDDVRKLKAIADYQFGWGAGEALFKGNINVEKVKRQVKSDIFMMEKL